MATADQISRRTAAQILGVHPDTVSKMLGEGLKAAVVDRRGKGSALVFSRRAVESYAAGRAGRSGPLDPKEQRARRDAAQAALTEHRLSVEKGQYVLLADVEKGWTRLLGACRSYLLSLPDFMTARVCKDYQIAGEPGVYAALRKGVREALTQLADPATRTLCPNCGIDLMKPPNGSAKRKTTPRKKAKRKTRKVAQKKTSRKAKR